jgi:hypothetical protein
MVARFARVDISKQLGLLKNAGKIAREEAVNLAREVGVIGANEMKSQILASGTEFSQAARQAGINRGPGRFRTGNMYKSVDFRVEAGERGARSAFGWINNFEEYFIYQEQGFRNRFLAAYDSRGGLRVKSGGPIVRMNPFGGYKNTPGMFALRDARASVERELPALTKKYQAKIARRSRSK